MIIEDVFECSNNATAAAIANFTIEHRSRIFDVWKAAIRGKSTQGCNHILDILQQEYESNTDLLTILGYTLTGQIHAETSRLHGLVEKVRTKEYSISELFYEIFSLQDAFETTFSELGSPGHSDITASLKMTRRVLGKIFSAVLEQTSWIYEHVTESGKRGFCQMDCDGRITYCNSEMERIFEGRDIRGERLDKLFPKAQQGYIRQSILNKDGTIPGSRELEIPNISGNTTTVWSEIEPIIFAQEFIGSYAMLTDISPVAQRETAIFDASPWSVVKVDSLGYVTYANAEAMNLLGIDDYQGRQIIDFVEEEDKTAILDALKERQRGESSAYQLTLTPAGDNAKPIEIDICGVPVMDAGGGPVGSIGIFHSRELDKASRAIHSKIAKKHQPKEMLRAVAEIIHELIPFDVCIVTRFCTKDDEQGVVHYNPFFTEATDQDIYWQKKWTPMSEAMVRWMSRDKVEPYVMEEFLKLDEWRNLKDDPNVVELQSQGYKSFIFRVVGDGIPISSFALLSKNEQAFDDRACEILEKLPLDQVMMMARHQLDIKEMEFRFKLVKDIAHASSLADAAYIFVKSLQEEYEWLHVSLFRVERYQKQLVMQAQSSNDDMMLLPENYSQPIELGILAECISSGKILNNGDVLSAAQFKPGIIAEDGDTPTRSEMCCPILSDDEIHWVLNIEDTLMNAFSYQEEQAVIQACEEFGVLIERLSRHFSFQACFDSTTDPVIITDSADNIVRANPSAKVLLGDDENDVTGHLAAYFENQDQAQVLLNETRSAPTEVTLHKDINSKGVNMLMSCCVLPKEFGEKVYISKDLSRLRRMEELKYLSQLSYEVAAQSQSPLSLAFTWLRRLREGAVSADEIPELANKVMRQLRKVQATFDRMAFYDGDAKLESERAIKLNLVVEIKRMLDDFPESDRVMVALPDNASVPYIMADPVNISFVLESLFSYLLRYASRDRKIIVSIDVDNEKGKPNLKLIIDGSEPVHEIGNEPNEKFLERMRIDIAIGRRMLESLIESQNGRLIETERQNGRVIFSMEFPITEIEEVA